jgi:hypothetical protein
VLVHAELWKKYSFPSSAAMNPKPLSLRRLIVPLSVAMVFLVEDDYPVTAGSVRSPGAVNPGKRHMCLCYAIGTTTTVFSVGERATLPSATSRCAVTATLCEPATRGVHPRFNWATRRDATTENSNALISTGRVTISILPEQNANRAANDDGPLVPVDGAVDVVS